MLRKYLSFFVLFQIVFVFAVNAQQHFFKNINENEIPNRNNKRVIIPKKYKTASLNFNDLKSFLATLPDEQFVSNPANTPVLELPMPDGTIAKFNVWQSLIMEKDLAETMPNIRTYVGQGISDKYATVRFDVTELGFHAMILSSVSGSIFIDPYNQNTTAHYISYYKKDFFKQSYFKESVKRNKSNNPTTSSTNMLPAGQCNGAQLRRFRVAVGCTNQYAKAATGLANPTKSQAMSAITTTVNRVTAVYEQEISVRLILVTNNQNIVYVSTAADTAFGQFNNDVFSLINKSHDHISLIIGSANFDLGHTFCTDEGGVAWLGGVCDNDLKGGGVTGRPNPVGDPFDIDYVAHEMGHQLGADHTFNANTGACLDNTNHTPLNAATNCEPGSGSSIMAYAGICDDVGVTNDLQPNSDPQFHAVSLAEILDFTILGNGNNCAVVTNTNNSPPVVNAGLSYTIPINTPFILTGTATDPNNDALTYSWEQMDVGGTPANWNATQTARVPLFRSFTPQTNGTRFFPKIDDVLNRTTTIGERLPSITRSLNFRLTVRDNRAGGAGTCFDDASVSVNATGGAFSVTSQNAMVTWQNGETRTINWNRGNTNLAPFNASSVAIELSTDGGLTFPITLAANTANDGTENITVPSNFTNTARVRVRALGNIFYAINTTNFKIEQNLPVKWLSFSAKKIENKIALQWQVNEVDNKYFEVEKSKDGKNFEPIFSINSKSNSSLNIYAAYDNNPLLGKNYYRIKQVDVDGKFTYSNIVSVLFEQGKKSFELYPNPVKGSVNIVSSSNTTNVKLEIIDAIGKIVFVKNINQLNANEVLNINTTSLQKGLYMIRINKGENDFEISKLIVE